MGGRSIGALLLVGGLFAALARGTDGAAPWSLEQITTPELTPERLIAALPPTFADFPLQPPETAGQPPSFATARTTQSYGDPNDPALIAAIITIDTLADGVAMPGALATLSDENAIAKPRWEVEEQDLSPEAVVPYTLATEENVDGSAFSSVSWGNQTGAYLFTIAARTPEERATLVQTVIDRLNQGTQVAAEEATATAVAQTGESVAAQQTAIAQTVEAQTNQGAALDATAAALVTEDASLAERQAALAATVAAVETEAAGVAAAATAFAATAVAPGPAATMAALETRATEQAEVIETVEGDLAAAEDEIATLEAVDRDDRDAGAAATPVQIVAGTPAAIRTAPIEMVITIDGAGLTQGDADAEDDAIEELESALTPLAEADCRIGFAIAQASAPSGAEGTAIAVAVNDLIAAEFPDLADGTGFYGYARVPGTPGEVALFVFPNEGCSVA